MTAPVRARAMTPREYRDYCSPLGRPNGPVDPFAGLPPNHGWRSHEPRRPDAADLVFLPLQITVAIWLGVARALGGGR